MASDLKKIPVHVQVRVLDEIERQLSFEPAVQTRNRKMLMSLVPPWDAEPPVWELRVGEYRVFYDVLAGEKTVCVRAVLKKPHDKRTEEIL